MRLTRRGWATVGVVAVAVVLGWQFGSRSLNAIAAPLVGALLLGLVQVFRADEPTVSLRTPPAGFPDEDRPLSITVSGSGMAVVGVSLPAATASERVETVVSLPHTFERGLALQTRGFHTVGPVTVTQQGPLGLVERRVETEERTEVVVYPRRYDVSAGSPLGDLFVDEFGAERQAFERLREYVVGDPQRTIHWKSSAKHDDFLVVEFAPSDRTETVTIAGVGDGTAPDELASATLAVAELAFDAGLDVEVVVADGTAPTAEGPTNRESVRRLLARTGGGPLPEETCSAATVVVEATADGTTIRTGARDHDLQRLLTNEPETGGVSA